MINSKEARDTEDSQEAEDVADEESRGVMTSPTVSSRESNYPPNIHETRTIEVPKGKKIRMQFSQYDVESCCDYVRITDEDGTVLKKDKHQPAKKPIVSSTDTVHVLFYTDSTIERKGWRLEWGEFYYLLWVIFVDRTTYSYSVSFFQFCSLASQRQWRTRPHLVTAASLPGLASPQAATCEPIIPLLLSQLALNAYNIFFYKILILLQSFFIFNIYC